MRIPTPPENFKIKTFLFHCKDRHNLQINGFYDQRIILLIIKRLGTILNYLITINSLI